MNLDLGLALTMVVLKSPQTLTHTTLFFSHARRRGLQRAFPTHSRIQSPFQMEAETLARIVASLGFTRVTVIFTADEYGWAMLECFQQMAIQVGVTTVTTLGIPGGLDQHTAVDASQYAEIGRNLVQPFNLKVAVMMVPVEIMPHGLNILNATRLLGPGTVTLLPSTQVKWATSPTTDPVYSNLLRGSIGIMPNFDADADVPLYARWPMTDGNWSDLLATATQLPNVSGLPRPNTSRESIGLWPKKAWDATLFAGRAVGAARVGCNRVGLPSYSG